MTNAAQQELFPVHAHSRESLAQFLNEGANVPVRIVLTRNKTSMLSIRFRPDAVGVRIHEAFLDAPPEILLALRGWLKNRRRALWSQVADYARRIPVKSSPPKNLCPAGEVYDLEELMREISAEFFNGKTKCRITWGRPGRRKRYARTRSIHWGTYDSRRRLIRIHPLLDSRKAPRDFVKYIIYHELLHDCIPAERRNGRSTPHHAAFKKMDRKFPGWEKMQQISAKLLKILV